jgi:hypothetical protein
VHPARCAHALGASESYTHVRPVGDLGVRSSTGVQPAEAEEIRAYLLTSPRRCSRGARACTRRGARTRSGPPSSTRTCDRSANSGGRSGPQAAPSFKLQWEMANSTRPLRAGLRHDAGTAPERAGGPLRAAAPVHAAAASLVRGPVRGRAATCSLACAVALGARRRAPAGGGVGPPAAAALGALGSLAARNGTTALGGSTRLVPSRHGAEPAAVGVGRQGGGDRRSAI